MNNLLPNRGFTLVEIMVVVVIVGLMSAMAIPAFEEIRSIAQDNAVTNNLRQLSAAADQYYIEYGVSVVGSSLLVGTDDSQYIRQIQTVAGESYGNFEVGSPVTAMGVAGSRTITYVN